MNGLRRALRALKERDDAEYCHEWECAHCGARWLYNSDSTSPLYCPECHRSDFEYVRRK